MARIDHLDARAAIMPLLELSQVDLQSLRLTCFRGVFSRTARAWTTMQARSDTGQRSCHEPVHHINMSTPLAAEIYCSGIVRVKASRVGFHIVRDCEEQDS